MRRFFICLILVIAAISDVLAQDYWKIDIYRDEFGEPIKKANAIYARNTNVRNDYSYLDMTFAFDSQLKAILHIGVVSTTGFAPERREVSAPATLSIKTQNGKIHRFYSNDGFGGQIWFRGDDAIQIGRLFENSSYDLVLSVKSALDGTKTYRYSVWQITQGLANTVDKMADMATKGW